MEEHTAKGHFLLLSKAAVRRWTAPDKKKYQLMATTTAINATHILLDDFLYTFFLWAQMLQPPPDCRFTSCRLQRINSFPSHSRTPLYALKLPQSCLQSLVNYFGREQQLSMPHTSPTAFEHAISIIHFKNQFQAHVTSHAASFPEMINNHPMKGG